VIRIDIKDTTKPSVIHIGERLENLSGYLPAGRRVMITDTNVLRLYGDRFPSGEVIAIGTGEPIKTLETVQEIFQRLIDLEVDRSAFIVGIGGGIVSDVTGFVASTYQRGLRFGFAATTLLAQVDASVGGKNGVNFNGYKNMVGVFNQPEFVLCDPATLTTLPAREVRCGMAEIVKHAAIASADLFDFLETRAEEALALEPAVVQRLVAESVEIKAAVVSRDERETGERRKLNFGHTFGHAIEKTTGVNHGEAVSAGMVAAARLSVQRGRLDTEGENRIERLLRRLDLPVRVAIDEKAVIDALHRDKKRESANVHFVMLDAIGKAVVENIALDELQQVARHLMGQG
jgi:3-dehydroquinate synthase